MFYFIIKQIVYRKFAPKCSVCQFPIMPEIGQDETVRFVALDRSFHVQCYRCEVSILSFIYYKKEYSYLFQKISFLCFI